VEVWEPPVQGAPDVDWIWRELSALSVERFGCSGCVLSDGRFAVLGGHSNLWYTSRCASPFLSPVACGGGARARHFWPVLVDTNLGGGFKRFSA
jgi:hypothetical protein